MNIVKIDFRGNGSCTLSGKTVEALSQYMPKGCPFKNYTLLDLLKDFVIMHSWKFPASLMSTSEFVEKCAKYDIKAEIYGKDMINLLEENL